MLQLVANQIAMLTIWSYDRTLKNCWGGFVEIIKGIIVLFGFSYLLLFLPVYELYEHRTLKKQISELRDKNNR